MNRLLPRLTTLTPPPAQAQVFAQLVVNERALASDYARGVTTSPTNAGQDPGQFMVEDQQRWGYGSQLGAAECNGSLPRTQWEAVARATQGFDLTSNPHEACRTLVTDQFVQTMWGYSRDPMAACRQELQARRSTGTPAPQNILVTNVFGVGGVQASVHFEEVPNCGCIANLTANLYLLHGRWLVSSIATS